MQKTKQLVFTQALAFAGQLLPAIVGVLSFMLLVRVASPEALGEFIIYMAAIVLFEMVKSGGLQSAIVMRVAAVNKDAQKNIIGSAYWLGGIFSVTISIVLAILYLSGVFNNQPGVAVFCGWYACLGLITLPLHIAEAEAVAAQQLKFLFWLRITQSANALIIALYAYFTNGGLKEFASIHLVFTLMLMLVVIALKKTNPKHIFYKTTAEVKNLFHLIKYSLATLATTNLLKTADTFLIGSLMGPQYVAIYAIPLKLTELFEIPLRSLSTTAFPQLANFYNQKNAKGFIASFIQFISWSYLIYIPALIAAFVFAPYIVLIIGGNKYADATSIFRVFILFGIFLPANRMTGIALDAMQQPAKNFIKVLIMAIVNIIGDLIVIHYTKQLEWIAFISVLNAALGAMIGWWLVKKSPIFNAENIFNSVYKYCTLFVKQAFASLKLIATGHHNNEQRFIL
jgi:O-antigen/teichoic acid export membrane protein